MASESTLRILVLVTDLSFMSGDHLYISKLVRYLREVRAQEFEVHIAELSAHATGSNAGIYDAMSGLAVTVHSMGEYRGGTLEFRIPAYLKSLIETVRPTVVHSHHFYTDLCAFVCRLGGAEYIRRLAGVEHAAFIPLFSEVIHHLSRERNFSQLLQDILPLKTWTSSQALEPSAFAWVSTKHATEPLSMTNRAVFNSLYPQGSLVSEIATTLNINLQQLVSGHCDTVVTINDAAATAWRELGVASRMINVASVGSGELKAIEAARPSRSRVRRALNAHPDGLIYLFASRMATKKQPVLLAEAFELHLREFPNDRLVLVGEGPELAGCLAIQKREERVHVLGYRPREEVFSIMAASDAFCLFSVEEGLPMSVMEAMASRLPILATAVGGIPEIVEDGLNGFIAPGKGTEQIRATLRRFSSLPAGARGKLAEEAERYLASAIDETATFEAYCQLYRDLASNPSNRAHAHM